MRPPGWYCVHGSRHQLAGGTPVLRDDPPDLVAGGNFWQAGYPPQPTCDPLPGRADAVVAGGGLSGLSAALALRHRGLSVVVLEAAYVGAGASGSNGGQVLTGFNLGLNELAERFGAATAQALWEETVAAVQTVEDLVRRYRIECDWHRGGHLEAAVDERDWIRLARERDRLQHMLGYSTELWDAERTAAEIGTPYYRGALYDPGCGSLNPYRLVQGLAAAARRAGAVVAEGVAFWGIEAGTRFTIRHSRGRIRAPVLILAGNAFLPRWRRAFRPWLVPITARIVATAALPAAWASRLLPRRPTVSDSKRPMYYFQKSGDGHLVFGGGGRGAAADEFGLSLHALREVFPMLADVAVPYRWRGPIALSRDTLPHLGLAPAGYYYVGGYSGHGVALAVRLGGLLGEWAAAAAAAPAEPWAALAFPPPALHFRRGLTRRRR